MSIIRNIAGAEALDYQADFPQVVSGAGADIVGLFSGIVQGTSTAASASVPYLAAVQQGINMLPEGKVKTAVEAAAAGGIFKLLVTLFQHRPFTRGQYRLGERLVDQVLPGPVDARGASRGSDVTDQEVRDAILLFTILFGVRIITQEDLDALQQGADAYYARPGQDWKGMHDIPREAVDRAVMLKQKYFPDSTYNTQKWNMDVFARYPLVAPIPDPYTYAKLYTGPLPGGGTAENGVIVVDNETPLSNISPSGKEPTPGGDTNMLLLLGAAVVGFGIWQMSKKRKK